MPNRILKDRICSSEEIDELSWFEEVFFYRLIVNADDYGRFDGRTKILKAALFPLKDVTEKQIESAIHKLSTVGLIVAYKADDKPILQLVTWAKHQSIRNKKSKYPLAEDGKLKSIEINCNQLNTNAVPIQSNTIQYNPNTIQNIYIPNLDEIREYCDSRNSSVDPEEFYDYYQATGWTFGNPPKPIQDWKARIRYWEKHSFAKKSKKTMPKYFNKLDGLSKEKPSAEEIEKVRKMAKGE